MSEQKKWSRRDFLKLTGAGIGSLVIADWMVEGANYSSLLAKEAKTYAKSMGFKEDKVIAQSSPVELVDIKGQKLKIVIDSQTAIPLMIADERGDWMPISRKELGAHGNKKFGILIDGFTISDPDIIKSEFNVGALSNDWGWRVINEDDDDFTSMEERIKICRSLGINDFSAIAIIGAGVPKDSIPGVLLGPVTKGTIPKNALFGFMAECIQKTMNHFKGMNPPIDYVVINEPFLPQDPYVGILGGDYVEKMYQIARETDAAAKLVYNIPDSHWSGGRFTKMNLKVVQRLTSLGLVDIVGHQMHLDSWTVRVPAEDIQKTILSYGVESIVTEFDIDIRDLQGLDQDRALEQAKFAEEQLGALLPVVNKIIDWGIRSDQSWKIMTDPDNPDSYRAQPNDWNADGSRRPSYYTKLRAILRYSIKPDQRALIGI